MNIAAGVLLILAALFNGCAGTGYIMGGVARSAAGVARSRAAESAKDHRSPFTPKADDTKAMVTTTKAGGVGLLAFGLSLYAMVGLQIAAAVVLFMKKARGFIAVIAALGIVAEVIGIMLTALGWTNIIGIVGALLALVALRSFRPPQTTPPLEAGT